MAKGKTPKRKKAAKPKAAKQPELPTWAHVVNLKWLFEFAFCFGADDPWTEKWKNKFPAGYAGFGNLITEKQLVETAKDEAKICQQRGIALSDLIIEGVMEILPKFESGDLVTMPDREKLFKCRNELELASRRSQIEIPAGYKWPGSKPTAGGRDEDPRTQKCFELIRIHKKEHPRSGGKTRYKWINENLKILKFEPYPVGTLKTYCRRVKI